LVSKDGLRDIDPRVPLAVMEFLFSMIFQDEIRERIFWVKA